MVEQDGSDNQLCLSCPGACKRWPLVQPGLRRPFFCRLFCSAKQQHSSFRISVVFLRYAQDLRDFFLNLNDGFSLLEFLCKSPVLAFQSGNFLGHRVDLFGFSATFPGQQAMKRPLVTLFAPGADIRMIEPLSTKQSTDLTGHGTGHHTPVEFAVYTLR